MLASIYTNKPCEMYMLLEESFTRSDTNRLRQSLRTADNMNVRNGGNVITITGLMRLHGSNRLPFLIACLHYINIFLISLSVFNCLLNNVFAPTIGH